MLDPPFYLPVSRHWGVYKGKARRRRDTFSEARVLDASFQALSVLVRHQRGGGLKPGIIMGKLALKVEEQHVTIKAVLPTEQTAVQAKSKLEREDINSNEVEKVFQNLSKRQRERTKRKAQGPSSSSTKHQKRADQKRRARKFSLKRRDYTQKNVTFLRSHKPCRYSTKNWKKESCRNWSYSIYQVHRQASIRSTTSGHCIGRWAVRISHQWATFDGLFGLEVNCTSGWKSRKPMVAICPHQIWEWRTCFFYFRRRRWHCKQSQYQ